jgi:hypothetical protein
LCQWYWKLARAAKPCSASSACSSAVQNSQWIDEQPAASATSRTPATSAAVTAATIGTRREQQEPPGGRA